MTAVDRRRILISIPFAVTQIQARLLELRPNPRLTRDQVKNKRS
jgi:hypothetical protein